MLHSVDADQRDRAPIPFEILSHRMEPVTNDCADLNIKNIYIIKKRHSIMSLSKHNYDVGDVVQFVRPPLLDPQRNAIQPLPFNP